MSKPHCLLDFDRVFSCGRSSPVHLQDMVLFNDTIFYNISYGRPGASAEEVYDAARRVSAAIWPSGSHPAV